MVRTWDSWGMVLPLASHHGYRDGCIQISMNWLMTIPQHGKFDAICTTVHRGTYVKRNESVSKACLKNQLGNRPKEDLLSWMEELWSWMEELWCPRQIQIWEMGICFGKMIPTKTLQVVAGTELKCWTPHSHRPASFSIREYLYHAERQFISLFGDAPKEINRVSLCSYFAQEICNIWHSWLVVEPYPSEKYVRQLGWFSIPNMMGKSFKIPWFRLPPASYTLSPNMFSLLRS